MNLTSLKKNFFWRVCALMILSACVEPYQPPVTKEESNLLVVEGYINTNTNVVSVKLSRTVSLSKAQTFPAELKAVLSIESEDGVKTPLIEKTGGNYEQSGLILNASKKYRLRIVTKEGSSYASEYIGLNPTPVLDDVTWKPEENGTTIYANAHDPAGKVKYYKWNYTESWQYTSNFTAAYKLVNNVVIPLTSAEDIFTCWSTTPAPNLLLASTAHLTEAVVYQFPLTFIPVGSMKLSFKYSIIVSLRGVDETEYNYWQQVQKTTENIGGLYDPLPTQVLGNMHNEANANEKVLGYFSGGGVQEKRIYISHYDLPEYLRKISRPFCQMDTINVGDLKIYGNGLLLISGLTSPSGPNIYAYTYSTVECVDCRRAGGVTTKPPFWP